MGTHDNSNKAEPQNQFISGFIVHGSQKQPPLDTQSSRADSGFASRQTSGLMNRMVSNPYQLSQQIDKHADKEQSDSASPEKNSCVCFLQKIKSKFLAKANINTGDARQKIMMALIPVLFIIMIFMFRQVLWKEPEKTKAASDNDKVIITVAKSSGSEIDWKVPDPLPVDMRDPIKIKIEKSHVSDQIKSSNNDIEELDVKSILYTEDKPSAVIGDRIVYLNQTVNGVTVVEIHQEYIVCEKNGKRWQQRVNENQNR